MWTNQRQQTKSGLSVVVVDVQGSAGSVRHSLEHPWVIRLTHWLNVVTFVIMTGSGLEIFAAFPSFGDKIPQVDLVQVPTAVRLGGWLGGALQWHLTFLWLFMATGAVYLLYQGVSGHWRQTLLQPRELGGVWPMARHYFLFGPKPDQTEPYNPLQKLAYTFTIVCGCVMVVTGWMLYKPVQLDGLVQLSGGFARVRLWHFLGMCGFIAFIPGHLFMVALHGWNNFRSMLTGWKRDPDYL